MYSGLRSFCVPKPYAQPRTISRVPKSIKLSDAFAQAVEQALEHYSDASWLGKRSPLGAPYFLGSALDGVTDPATPAARGAALQSVLQTAAATLPEDALNLLNVAFFKRDPTLNNTGVALRLGKAETTYYRHRAVAIEALAEALNKSIAPPLHAFVPSAPPLAGREDLLSEVFTHLRVGRSVSLTGRSGIGKTALGLTIAQTWGSAQAFWFTVRPTLNDNLSSFAFALAYFLRSQNTAQAANTWRQLMADRGDIQPDRVLALLRFDLAALPQPMLLCVDDSDQLHLEMRAHAQIIHLIEELSKTTPTLLLSQHALIESDVQVALRGLSEAETAQLLHMHTITDLAPTELQTLHTITRGLPLLIKLFADLRRTGETTTDLLRYLEGERSAEALFSRLWKKLSNTERSLLMLLALFRSPIPASALLIEEDALSILSRLVVRDLVQRNQQGTIAIATQLQAFVQHRIPADEAPALHAHAAELYESLSEYTPAAFHWAQAEQPVRAIWLWWNHRELERGRGNMPAASELFRQIKQVDLPNDDDRRALTLLRAEQSLRVGQADDAEAELSAFAWPSTHTLTPTARGMMGDALQMQGRVEQAIEQYQKALDALADDRPRKIGQMHAKIGYVHIARLRDLARARHEALLALHQAHNFYGSVEEEAGNYAIAQAQYDAAMQLGEAMPNTTNREHVQAVTHSNLGNLYLRIGQAASAIQHLQRAMQNARDVGETVNSLYDQFNLSAAYTANGQPEQALIEASEVLALAEAISHNFLIAGAATNAAEACLALGRLDEAEHFAQRALREEEERLRPLALTLLGRTHQKRGQLARASEILHEAVMQAQDIQDKLAEATALRALGAVLREQGRNDEAEEVLAKGIAHFEALGLVSEMEAAKGDLA
jgi:tetratricopeptide (TPR) repeat protein